MSLPPRGRGWRGCSSTASGCRGGKEEVLPNCCWPVADAERKRREEEREKQIEEKQPRMPTRRLLGDTS